LSRLDRQVLVALQVLVLALPLFLGGRQGLGVALASATVLALGAVTLLARRRRGSGARVPGAAALAAFALLALLSVVPLPPAILEALSPATAKLYRDVLPGWPGAGGWSLRRPIALSTFDVATTLNRFSIALGAFVVLLAFPWRSLDEDDEARVIVLDRLVLTLILGGVAMSALALFQQFFGNGWVMWVSEEPASEARISGPFVNPNHFAAWLEMVMPLALATCLTLLVRLRRRVSATANSSRGLGVRSRRVWVSALVAHQESLWPPIVAAAGFLLMFAAHAGADSRGGNVALLAGTAVTLAGLVRHLVEPEQRRGLGRWVTLLLPLGLLGFAGLVVASWWRADTQVAEAGLEGSVDLSLGARVAAYRLGVGILRDFPLLGTGLGSWLDAFRPYQAPPLESGILDHAHNDYLELAAETGFVGMAIVAWFGGAVALAIWRERRRVVEERGLATVDALPEPRRPAGFELPEWRQALRHHHLIRWGLAGGVTAILVHSLVEFALRMPGNLLLVMVLLAMMVLGAGPLRPGRAASVPVLFLCFLAAAIPPAANAVLVRLDRDPLSPRDRVERAEFLLSEEPEDGYERAVGLARSAVDDAPALIEAHEMMANVLGDGPESLEFLRRAVALQPWAVERRDALGQRLVEEGDVESAAQELGESMFRYPSLMTHGYLFLTPIESRRTDGDLQQVLHQLESPSTMKSRIGGLPPEVADALEAGLLRALEQPGPGMRSRASVTEQLAQLLETRGKWDEAGEILFRQGRAVEDVLFLTRAAADHLVAKNYEAAEKALLAALVLAPDQASIYHDLATRVYAPTGDYDRADAVLDAGRRNAADLLPLHRGMSELLDLRKQAERRRYEETRGRGGIQPVQVKASPDATRPAATGKPGAGADAPERAEVDEPEESP